MVYILLAIIVAGIFGYTIRNSFQVKSGNQGAAAVIPTNITNVVGYEIIKRTVSTGPNGLISSGATCSAGKKVVGGGYNITNASGGTPTWNYYTTQSYPRLPNGDAWMVTVKNKDLTQSVSIDIYAVCVN